MSSSLVTTSHILTEPKCDPCGTPVGAVIMDLDFTQLIKTNCQINLSHNKKSKKVI